MFQKSVRKIQVLLQ